VVGGAGLGIWNLVLGIGQWGAAGGRHWVRRAGCGVVADFCVCEKVEIVFGDCNETDG